MLEDGGPSNIGPYNHDMWLGGGSITFEHAPGGALMNPPHALTIRNNDCMYIDTGGGWNPSLTSPNTINNMAVTNNTMWANWWWQQEYFEFQHDSGTYDYSHMWAFKSHNRSTVFTGNKCWGTVQIGPEQEINGYTAATAAVAVVVGNLIGGGRDDRSGVDVSSGGVSMAGNNYLDIGDTGFQSHNPQAAAVLPTSTNNQARGGVRLRTDRINGYTGGPTWYNLSGVTSIGEVGTIIRNQWYAFIPDDSCPTSATEDSWQDLALGCGLWNDFNQGSITFDGDNSSCAGGGAGGNPAGHHGRTHFPVVGPSNKWFNARGDMG